MCRTSITRSLETIAILALLAGCSGGASGPQETQQREVGGFQRIELRGSADVTVTVGPAAALTATGDAGSLRDLRTEVRDGRLVIEQEHGWHWFSSNLKLQVSTPALEGFAIRGAGDVSISGTKGAKLELSIDGAGDLHASGTIDALEAHIKGAGDMDLSQLQARDAKVSIRGAGDLQVRATGALDATISGAGSIRYAGNPQPVKTQINGAGSITPVN
jgi:hypothetical protein